jgi:hypothetical protein
VAGQWTAMAMDQADLRVRDLPAFGSAPDLVYGFL